MFDWQNASGVYIDQIIQMTVANDSHLIDESSQSKFFFTD